MSITCWTTAKPNVEGFYWCKCRGQLSGKIHTTVVAVYRPNATDGLRVFWDGENFSINDDCFTAWSGPIEPPGSPT